MNTYIVEITERGVIYYRTRGNLLTRNRAEAARFTERAAQGLAAKARRYYDEAHAVNVERSVNPEPPQAASGATEKGPVMPSYSGDMRELPDGRIEMIDLDELYAGEPCPICGCEMERERCDQCEDGYSYHDCGEDCCCCLDPEPNVRCDICDGEGGWWYCPLAYRHPVENEKASAQ